MAAKAKAALQLYRWRCWQCGTSHSVKGPHGKRRVWQCRNCKVICETDWSHKGRDSRSPLGYDTWAEEQGDR